MPHFSPVLGEVGTSPSDLQTAQATTQSPIIRYDSDSPVKYEKSSFGIFLRLLIAAAALAAIAYILFLRR